MNFAFELCMDRNVGLVTAAVLLVQRNYSIIYEVLLLMLRPEMNSSS